MRNELQTPFTLNVGIQHVHRVYLGADGDVTCELTGVPRHDVCPVLVLVLRKGVFLTWVLKYGSTDAELGNGPILAMRYMDSTIRRRGYCR